MLTTKDSTITQDETLSMRDNIRRRTKCIYFKIINATAKESGSEHYQSSDEYVIDRKKSAPIAFSQISSPRSRY